MKLMAISRGSPKNSSGVMMNDHFWGISGWRPFWFESTHEFLARLEDEKLCGSAIKSTWTLWDDNERFEDAPIVVLAGKKQLEFCAAKIGVFSVSVNTIDVREPVSWCEEPRGLGPLKWKKDADTLLAKLTGKCILEAGAIEYCLDENTQKIFNKKWVLSGVYLSCESAYVEIFNALDSNGITDHRNGVAGLKYFSSKA